MVARHGDNSSQRIRRRKVAIIGSGLAGLTAAHLLSKEQFDVHIFEKSTRIGLDAASIDVRGQDGKIYTVDSPMRAVQSGYYSHLLQLYKKLGIQLQRTDFTYSFMKLSSPRQFSNSGLQSKDQQTHKKTTFIYNGQNGLSLRPVSVPEVADLPVYSIDMLFHIFDFLLLTIFFALSYIYLLLLSSYHYFSGHLKTKSTHWLAQATFADFLHGTYIPPTFAEDILIPLFACVATCSPEELLDYPAAEFLEYIVKTFGQVHYTVRDGVKTVVDGLLVDISRRDQVHLDCELVSMRRSLLHPGKLELEDSAGQILLFDHIIFATQANQAVNLMQTYHKSLSDEPVREDALLAQERKRIDALKQFKYTHSVVVNHYDGGCTLGISAANKRMLNIATWQDSSPQSGQKADTSKQVSGNYTMATHDLSIAHPRLTTLKGKPLLQTTNPTVDIAEEYIVSKKRFERAIVTRESKRALAGFLHPGEKGSMQGGQGIWFVGAWAAEGIPLLEGCVVSAERVVEAIKRSHT